MPSKKSKKKISSKKTKGSDNLEFIKNVSTQSNSIKEENILKINYPVFCFKYLEKVSIKNSKDHDFFYNFLIRLKKLSELGWKEIAKSDRKSYGTENIPLAQIHPSKPSFLTPDVNELICFRANGDNRPFLGFRNGNIFHVIFIEANFNDIYDHD